MLVSSSNLGPKLLKNLESTPYEELEKSLRQSLQQVENRTMSAQGSAVFLVLHMLGLKTIKNIIIKINVNVKKA